MSGDLELLEAWRGGDVESGDRLFQRHFGAIRQFFRNKLAATDVEDAVQKTFLACVESRDAFRGDSSFRTYLFTVARHQLYRSIRKRARDAVAAGLDVSTQSLCDLGISPSTAFAQGEEQRVVLEALQRLPVDQQVLLELYYWQDVPGPELAVIFDVAPATIRTWLHRARKKLRELVEQRQGAAGVADVEATARAIA